MAGELTTTQSWADGDQVTSTKLNAIISGASFTTDAVTGTTLTVTGGKLKVGTITSSEMGALSVGTTALAASAVTSAKIADGNITTAKLATGAVTTAKIADEAITMAKLDTGLAATEAVMEAETGGYVVTPDFVKHSKRVTKVHGCVALGVSSRTLQSNSVNVTSVSRDSASTTKVTLTTNMASGNYTVVATWESSGTADNAVVSVYDKTAGSFYLKHDTESAGKRINFVAFGTH